MHIEFLVEEPSVEPVIQNLLPKILGDEVTFAIHPHQGKTDLLPKLPSRLKAYRRWLPNDWRIVVLLDRDQEDCRVLKKHLEQFAEEADFVTKSRARNGVFQIINRMAIEELEAWFFGDTEALREAYPRIPKSLERKENFRDPDAIKGGTWEALERVLQKAGYFKGGLAKIEAARKISSYMEPQRNRSNSFRAFRDGLLELIGQRQ